MKKILGLVPLAFILLTAVNGQLLPLESVLDSIRQRHPLVKMYSHEIRSMDEAAKGARSWMPPEFSSGLWMAPYNPSMWRKSSMGEPGMGQFMIGGQQMIPNRKKLDADEAYMQSMSAAEKDRLNATLNEFCADAKSLYHRWQMLKKRLTVLKQNAQLLDFMILNAENRYRNGLEKINAYYKAKAALGNIHNMQMMAENEIRETRIRINTLMGRNALQQMEIDTNFTLRDYSAMVFDSTAFYNKRSSLKAIDNEIRQVNLKQASEQSNLKPQFGIRYDHMFGFGGLPMQFNLMGMLKLPMSGWSSRMTRAGIESLKWKSLALQSQKEMLVNEYSGMAYGMRSELELRRGQMKLYEQQILPALANNYKTMQLGYAQNTEELFMLFDAWETHYMAQLAFLDILADALQKQVELERIMEIQ
jgi:outer membrane protein TolC